MHSEASLHLLIELTSRRNDGIRDYLAKFKYASKDAQPTKAIEAMMAVHHYKGFLDK